MKFIFTLFAALLVQFSFAQTTYYWVGGTTPIAGAWNTGTNWNTALDGSGTTRGTSATTDILVFDGTNVGGSTPATGAVTVSLTSQTIAKLVLQNGADVTLSRNGIGSTTTLTIGDEPNGDDLVVFAGCTLRLGGLTGSMLVLLSNNAGTSNAPPATTSGTARIYGTLVLKEGDNTYQNRFTSRFKGAFVIASGGSVIAQTGYNFYPFGTTGSTSATPALHGVVFESGSSFIYNGGLSPFGSNSTSFQTEFQPGSKFYFRAANQSNMFGNRSYGDVFVENNATVTANGSLLRIDNFTIETGSTYITHTSGSTPVHGNIVVNGTLRVPAADPDRDNRVVLAGTNPQTISGTGTITLADLIVSDVSNATLQKSMQIDSVLRVIGDMNATGYTINGTGTISAKAPASLNLTGNLNTDSLLVKNVSDFTGIEVGMSVTGTGIPANTVITNTSSSSGTITLSKAVTGAVTYAGSAVALTIFNGQGVLPVKFTSFGVSFNRSANKVTAKWEIASEEKVTSYIIERSVNGTEFSSVGVVAAANRSAYTFEDNNPIAGVSYYRIKALDIDGRSVYTSIAKISSAAGATDFTISPNPVKGNQIKINANNLEKNNYSIIVLNTSGQKVYNQDLGTISGALSKSIMLPNQLQPGVYTIILRSNDQQVTERVIIQ